MARVVYLMLSKYLQSNQNKLTQVVYSLSDPLLSEVDIQRTPELPVDL